MDQTADYVIAGAGSAGCILARRLADSGASVVLLEAGGPDRSYIVRKPGMIAIFHNVPDLKKRLDWGYYSAPRPARSVARSRRSAAGWSADQGRSTACCSSAATPETTTTGPRRVAWDGVTRTS